MTVKEEILNFSLILVYNMIPTSYENIYSIVLSFMAKKLLFKSIAFPHLFHMLHQLNNNYAAEDFENILTKLGKHSI